MKTRTEHDTMGEIEVPADKYWGAQTERSFENFKIGSEKMPSDMISAIALVKRACAAANGRLLPQKMTKKKADIIKAACDEIIAGDLDGNFPLSVWQTGSGTQTNMNVNEVIANRGNEMAGEKLLHPNDDVNLSQSSNDVFPTAMHVAAVLSVEKKLLPSLEGLALAFKKLEEANMGVMKIGRTHLQDATPIAFSDEISGWRSMAEGSADMIKTACGYLRRLAIGGTAVGTGLNAPRDFDTEVCGELGLLTGFEFNPSENKFYAMTSKDALCFAHGAIKAAAANLMKTANDIRWLASGPRCGLGEIKIPENEPGSSIMPGKVNPTQCEAMTMVAVQIMGNDTTITLAASQGNFELNVFMPVIVYNFLQSADLLSDAVRSFTDNCVVGIVADREKMRENLNRSLMTAAALNPYIGYENAAKAVKAAYRENITLKDACVSFGFLTAERFDEIMKF